MAPLVVAWFCLNSVASLALPAYQGELGGERAVFIVVYGVVAGLVGVAVRKRDSSTWAALASSAPALVVLAAAAFAAALRHSQLADGRGEPLFLYIGIALWVSWALLVVAAAALTRTRWSSAAGIVLTLLVALLGWFLVTARFD